MITFSDIQFPNLKANCKHCGVTTIFTVYIRYRVDDDSSVLIIPDYQCQDCGKLKFSKPDNADIDEFLSIRCECNGQFLRDKPLYCNSCKKNKTELNISEI